MPLLISLLLVALPPLHVYDLYSPPSLSSLHLVLVLALPGRLLLSLPAPTERPEISAERLRTSPNRPEISPPPILVELLGAADEVP
eukprot:1617189-Pyramimonas_sp.AAC.1